LFASIKSRFGKKKKERKIKENVLATYLAKENYPKIRATTV